LDLLSVAGIGSLGRKPVNQAHRGADYLTPSTSTRDAPKLELV